MTRRAVHFGPSLIVGAGILGSTLVAAWTAESGGLVLAGPLLLSLAVIGADMLESRLSGSSSRPSRSALLLGGAILLASLIVFLRDPKLVKALIPVLGAPAWVSLVLRPEPRRNTCAVIE